MVGRVYSVNFENVAVSAAQDLFEISPAANKPILLHAIFLSQKSDLGDAQEEGIRLEVVRGHATSGSGGSSVTPTPMNPNDPAAGFGAEVNNTTIASAGTAVVCHADIMNIRIPTMIIWTPETRPQANNGNGTIVVRLMAAPADEITMSGTLYVEEL